jgi:hypothetical protein
MVCSCNGSGGGWGEVLAFVSGICVNEKKG